MKQALVALVVTIALAGCGSHRSGQKAAPLSAADLRGLSAGWKTDFARHTVPLREIMSGGPGKDGIPALDRPRFLEAADVSFLRPQEPVIALTLAGRPAPIRCRSSSGTRSSTTSSPEPRSR